MKERGAAAAAARRRHAFGELWVGFAALLKAKARRRAVHEVSFNYWKRHLKASIFG